MAVSTGTFWWSKVALTTREATVLWREHAGNSTEPTISRGGRAAEVTARIDERTSETLVRSELARPHAAVAVSNAVLAVLLIATVWSSWQGMGTRDSRVFRTGGMLAGKGMYSPERQAGVQRPEQLLPVF